MGVKDFFGGFSRGSNYGGDRAKFESHQGTKLFSHCGESFMGSRTKLVKITNDREAIWAWWEVFGVGFAKKFGSDEEQDESNAE